MSNEWLRLYHDMPTDPKWRTISRVSGRPITEVIAVFNLLLVTASRNVTRGHVTIVTEDIASAFDMQDEHVDAILNAMQGRIMEGDWLTGWDKRQVNKEDQGNQKTGAKSATARKREQREREKAENDNEGVTRCHAMSRDVTTDKIREDKIREEKTKDLKPPPDNTDSVVPITYQTPVMAEHGEHVRNIAKIYAKVWDRSVPMVSHDHLMNILRVLDAEPRSQDLMWWRTYFEQALDNDFINGTSNRTGEPMTFHWLIDEKNVAANVERFRSKAQGVRHA